MKVFVLWFNEWEANYVLGIFETYQEAERWKNYFLENPIGSENYFCDMEFYYKKRDKNGKGDYTDRFGIEEMVVGQLNQHIKLDNLKLLEWEAHKDEKANT